MAEAHPYYRQPSQDPAPSVDGMEDLLLLTALAAHVALVVLALPQSDGSWSLHWHGQPPTPPIPSVLLDRIAGNAGPTEIPDLLDETAGGAIGGSIRWVLGVAIRDSEERLLAVLVLLDPWLRTRSHREDTVVQKAARRIVDLLSPTSAVRAAQRVDAPVGRCRQKNLRKPGLTSTTTRTPRGPAATDRRDPALLRTADVAARFDVSERTVLNWAAAGKIPSIRTVGGHLRFREADIDALIPFR